MKLRGSKFLKGHKEMFSMKLRAESDLMAYMLVILALCRLRQEACSELEASVNDTERLDQAGVHSDKTSSESG